MIASVPKSISDPTLPIAMFATYDTAAPNAPALNKSFSKLKLPLARLTCSLIVPKKSFAPLKSIIRLVVRHISIK